MRPLAPMAALLLLIAAKSAHAEEKRAVPDYDGRGEEPTTAQDVALWVPRIVLSPLYVLTEYGIRWPLSVIIPGLEQAGLRDWFAGQSDYIVLPTVVIDFGFRPSIGVYSGINNLWFEGHEVRARFAFGGLGFWKVKLKDRVVFDRGRQRIGIYGGFRQREDDTFGGIGPDIDYDIDTVGRFTTQFIDAGLRYDYGLGRLTHLRVAGAFHHTSFEDEACCGPPLVRQIADGLIEEPHGFPEGHRTVHQELSAAIDTRRNLRSGGAWVRAQTNLSADVSIDRPGEQRWMNYGLDLGGGFEPGWPGRRLSLSVAALFADPLAEEDIPFDGLVRLGGDPYMRGFGGDALYGRSALVMTARYMWPIWALLDGTMHFAVGNVYGPHLADFEAEKLRMSFGIGVSTSYIDEESLFDILLAFGTETFEQGTELAAVRFAFGITEGF